jgi:predicted kinase
MLLATCLALGRKVVIDDTNVVKKTRRKFIELAKAYGYKVRGVFFDIPLEDALQRNADRTNPLDERAVRGKFDVFERPTIDEGFDKLDSGPTDTRADA